MNSIINRFYDVLLSIYIYNEYTGYTELEKLLAAIITNYPQETTFIEAVRKHMEDEKKHYQMFKVYFTKKGTLPYIVTKKYGYIDLFVKLIFKVDLQTLNQNKIISNEKEFMKLCRLIMMTEFRGMKQVNTLLRSPLIRRSNSLTKIFRVVEKDEPSHCFPYQYWLKKFNSHEPRMKEKLVDIWIHYSLNIYKVPILLLNGKLERMKEFYA